MATIQKRKGSYYIVVSLGYDSSGQQVRKSMTWKPPEGMTERQREKEAKRQAVLFEDKIKANQSYNQRMKFSEFLPMYFRDYAEKQLKQRTLYEYRRYGKRCDAFFGHMRISHIQPKHILDFCNYLSTPEARQQPGGRTKDGLTKRNDKQGEGLSGKTIKIYFSFLSSVLEKAVQWGFINSNPCARVDAPKVKKPTLQCLNEDELKVFFGALAKEPLKYQIMFLLDFVTGMRRGELLAIGWEDINFQCDIIHIRHSMSYVPGMGQFLTEPKTEASKRFMKIPSIITSMLAEYKRQCDQMIANLGEYWEHPDMVFTGLHGQYMSLNMPTTMLKRILKNNNLPICSIHTFRHTTASLLIAHGHDIKTVANYLGHSTPTTTLNIYAYQIDSAKAAAEKSMESLLPEEAFA